MNDVPAAAPLTVGRITAARRTLERVARDAVPTLADFCLVHLRLRGALIPVAGAHADGKCERHVRALMRAHRVPIDDDDSTAARVVRTGEAVLRAGIHHPRDSARRPNRVDALLERLAPRSAIVVPITARTTILGALSLCYSGSGRSYSPRDLPKARRIAARIADVLLPDVPVHAALRVRAAARHPRQGPTLRRRVAARN